MKRFLINLFQSFTSNIITLLFPLITIPFIIGELGVQEYGRIVLAQAVVAILSIIIEFGSINLLSSIFSKTHCNRKKLRVFLSSMLIRFIASLIIIFLVSLYLIFGNGDPILWYFFPMLLAEIINPTSICLSLERAKLLLFSTVVGRILSLILIFSLLLYGKEAEYVALSLSLGLLVTYLVALSSIIFEHNRLIMKMKFRSLKYKGILITLFFRSAGFAILRFTNMIKDKSIVFVTSVYLGPEAVTIYDIAAKIVNILNIPIYNFSNHLLIWKRKVSNPSVFSKLILLGGVIILSIVLIVMTFMTSIYAFFEVSLPRSYVLPIGILLTSILITYTSSVVGNYYLLGVGRRKMFIWTSYFSSLFLALILSYIIFIDGEVSFVTLVCAFILTNLVEMVIRLLSLRLRWSN